MTTYLEARREAERYYRDAAYRTSLPCGECGTVGGCSHFPAEPVAPPAHHSSTCACGTWPVEAYGAFCPSCAVDAKQAAETRALATEALIQGAKTQEERERLQRLADLYWSQA